MLKNGVWKYSVHWRNPEAPCGYSRNYFPSKSAADAFALGKESDAEKLGADWVDVPAADRAELMDAYRSAKKAGIDIRAAVKAAAAAAESGPAITVSDLFSACLTSKRLQGLRPRSLRGLESSLRRFQAGRESIPAASVTPGDLEKYLAGLDVSPRSRLGALIDLQTGFSYGVKGGMIKLNPCTNVPRPVVEQTETSVLTPEQTENLFRACEREAPDILGFLALSAFAGFRPESEVERMDRSAVAAGVESGFLAPPVLNKTRRRRLVPVCPCLRAWIEAWLPLGAAVIPTNFARQWNRVRDAAGIRPWPQNVLRHSRVSYRLAETGNAAQTADEDGHDAAMLHRNYKALVTPEAAVRYFGIFPTPGLDLKAAADFARARQEAKRRGGKDRALSRAKKRWASKNLTQSKP